MVIDSQTAAAILLLVLTMLTGIIGWLILREVNRIDEERKEFRERLDRLEKVINEPPASVKFPTQGGA